MHIFCDESGNTGTDLLSADQPVFSLASTSLNVEECASLVAPLLRQGQSEAKYSRLKGNARGQAALVDFFSSPLLTASTAKFLLAEKRYYLITHIVDKLIEPPLHESGIDLYDGDGHVGLVNVWYYAGHTILPNGHWERVLHAVLRAMRERTNAAHQNFDRVISAAAAAAAPDAADFATGLLLARGRLGEFLGVYGNSPVFDPAVDLFINLVNQWMVQEPGRFHLTHDQSKPLRSSEAFLRAMMTPLAPRLVGYGKRQAELPLRVSKFDFGDSRLLPQLQVADLIAGAAADCLLAWSGTRSSSSYHEAMRSTKLSSLACGGMIPSPEPFTRDNEAQPGQRSLVDGSAYFLAETGFFSNQTRSKP